MDISVIICTYNRCKSLRRTLETCANLTIPTGITWELLVVDNNSTDQTKQVCKSFLAQLPLRYFFEPRQGKSHALNLAVSEAKGEWLMFTDDDVDVERNWLANAVEIATRHPEITFFGGKVLSRWETPPPRWVLENLQNIRFLSHLDKGEKEQIIVAGQRYCIIGANMACRRSALKEDFRFNIFVGPTGADSTLEGNLRGEESDVLDKLLQRGHKGLYAPSVVVHHRQTASRLTEQYVRRFSVGYGIADVRLGIATQQHKWFGVPRYYWKLLAVNALVYACTRWLGPSRVWLNAEMRMAHAWGAVIAFRQCRETPPYASALRT